MASWLQSLFSTPMRASQPQASLGDLGFKVLTEQSPEATAAMLKAMQLQRNTQDATQGELGVILHPDGKTWSHEVSITEPNPSGQGWVNAPMLTSNQSPDAILRILFGQATPQDRAAALSRASERVSQGAVLPTYPTAKKADRKAMKREKGFWRDIRSEGVK